MAANVFSPMWPGPSVLVPMTTDILLVGVPDRAKTNTWSSTKYSYFNLLIHSLPDQPAPFGEKDAAPPVGANIMWTLPYSMRQGEQHKDTGATSFRKVPNRWLVTRFEFPYNINDNKIPDGAPVNVSPVIGEDGVHVVSGDTLYDISDAPNKFNQFPDPTDTDFPVKGIGKSYKLVEWKGEATQGDYFLQAVGPGDVSWSVSFDNITNVFALNDPLGVSKAMYTYSIVGWYDHPDEDLLYHLPVDGKKEDWLQKLREEYRWSIGEGIGDLDKALQAWGAWQLAHGLQGEFDPDKIDLPPQEKQAIIAWHAWLKKYGDDITTPVLAQQSICHSTIATVKWEGPDYGYGSGAPGGGTKAPDVAMGNTAIEAISAYMAHKIVGDDNLPYIFSVERCFEAFQKDLIFDLEKDPVHVETQLHNARFETGYAGHEWIVVLATQENDKGLNGGQQTIPLDEADTEALISINTQQFELNDLVKLMGSQRTELFALSIKKAYIKSSTPVEIKDRVTKSLTAITTSLQSNKDIYINIATQIKAEVAALRTTLGAKYEVKEIDLPLYAAPDDPVVMVASIDQSTKLSDPTQFGDGNFLNIRITGETISTIKVTAIAGGSSQTKTIGAKEILGKVNLPLWNAVPKEVMDLWLETMLLDQSCGRLFATIFLEMCGVQNPPNSVVNPIAEQIRKQQTAIWNDPGVLQCNPQTLTEVAGFSGVVPEQLSVYFRTVQPWAPLYMDWSVQWFPAGKAGQELSEWVLGDIDYEWAGTSINPDPSLQFFKGRALLNAQTGKVIQEKFKKFVTDPNYEAAKIPDYLRGSLDKVAHQIGKLDILTQSMSGLMKQLTTLLMTVDNYPLDEKIAGLLGDGATNFRPIAGSTTAKTPQPFFPIPSGHFQVMDLWIVDAYGQILRGAKQSPMLDIKWSESLVTEGKNYKGDTIQYGQVPPRLAQQAKVNLSLLQSDDDSIFSNSSDLTSPICGWVMADHLDNALIVFNAAGENQGTILKVGREAATPGAERTYTIRWDAVPGSNGVLGAPPVLENAHLQAFVDGLLATASDGSDAYDALMAHIDSSLWTMGNFGTQNGNLSLLLGRPIAVVRAEIDLSFAGMPLLNESWITTGDNYNDNGKWKLTNPPYVQTQFKVRVGDNQFNTNGVMGYFEANNYDTFYSVYGANGKTASLNKLFSGLKNGNRSQDFAAAMKTVKASNTDYVKTGHLLSLKPDGSNIKLTLLVDPSGNIPFISGSLPTGEVTLPNGPVDSALNNLKATFRAGPLLLDPDKIKMPTPAEVKGNWFWRARKDVTTWNPEMPITAATPVAGLDPHTPALIEGWIVLSGPNAKEK